MSIMPRWLKIIGLTIVGSMVLVVGGQLLYPASRMLPVSQIGEQAYWWNDEKSLRQRIDTLNTQPLVVQAAAKRYDVTLKDIGFTYDAEATMRQAKHYPLAHRFIPFSILGIGLKPHPLISRTDQTATHLFAQRIAEEGEVAPVNAGLKAQADKLVPIPSSMGQRYDPEAIARSLRNAIREGRQKLIVTPSPVPPAISTEAVSQLIPKAQQQVEAGLTLEVAGERLSPDRSMLASWFRLTHEDANRPPVIGVDGGAISQYLASAKQRFYMAPGTTTVRLVDDQEVSRTNGAVGRGIDEKAAAQQVLDALNRGQALVQLSTVPIAPKLAYVRSYSNTDAGLQSLLTYLASSKGSYAIAVREIGGRVRSASAGGGKQFVTASTYKLFVAYSTLKRIEAGVFSWSDRTHNTDLATCFDRMILNSDNPCAEALGARIGWSTLGVEMRALGLANTSFTQPVKSTADDEALLLAQLARGQILSTESRDRLLDRMKRQRYRQGIPAGTGTVVANKVGFLSSYLNDAAIVYGANTTYVLVILTSGSSWGQIADAARQIHVHMSQ